MNNFFIIYFRQRTPIRTEHFLCIKNLPKNIGILPRMPASCKSSCRNDRGMILFEIPYGMHTRRGRVIRHASNSPFTNKFDQKRSRCSGKFAMIRPTSQLIFCLFLEQIKNFLPTYNANGEILSHASYHNGKNVLNNKLEVS